MTYVTPGGRSTCPSTRASEVEFAVSIETLAPDREALSAGTEHRARSWKNSRIYYSAPIPFARIALNMVMHADLYCFCRRTLQAVHSKRGLSMVHIAASAATIPILVKKLQWRLLRCKIANISEWWFKNRTFKVLVGTKYLNIFRALKIIGRQIAINLQRLNNTKLVLTFRLSKKAELRIVSLAPVSRHTFFFSVYSSQPSHVKFLYL